MYDLALIKTLVGSGPFVAGDDVTFRITVFNQGNVPASSIQITDYIPTGLTLNDTTWNQVANTAMYTLPGTLAAGADTYIDITFTIDAGFSGTIDNLAEISSDDGNDKDSTTDTNPTNDTLVDDEINNGGGDEDDHDIETITVDPIDADIDCQVSAWTL